jgi:Secretion system C-terminal sorting domain
MKTKTTLFLIMLFITLTAKSQVLFNEVYTDPGGNKHEFFELYNTNTSGSSESLDNYTLVTFFEYTGGNGDIGFYVMDLPNLTIGPRGYFVGSAAIPFSYQGNANVSLSDYNWNNTVFRNGTTGGYIKKWVLDNNNLADGNAFYDEEPLAADFNDLFYRRVGVGASYTMFLYKNGVLVNGVIFGTGGYTEVIPIIIALPKLSVDMSGAAPDFEIDFSIYNTNAVRIEDVTEEAGSDNGYMREKDGMCGGWLKSSSQAEHTPQQSNGAIDINDGVISVSATITRGSAAAGSVVNYDVVAAPAKSFPVKLEIYNDMGPDTTTLDGVDSFIEENTENVVSDGPFATHFTPNTANILIVAKSAVGCIDKILFIPNVSVLPLKLTAFNGNRDGNKIMLDWTLSSNELAHKVVIEKSTDGKNFETVHSTYSTGKAGNENYEYSCNTADNKSYYRLRITEKSGLVSYSRTLLLNNESGSKANFDIIGNTVSDKLTIGFQSASNEVASISIVDMNGKLIAKQRINAMKGNNISNINLTSAMNSGMYIAVLTTVNGNSSAKFIKQ